MMKCNMIKKTWLPFCIGLLLMLSLVCTSVLTANIKSNAAESTASAPTLIGSELINNAKNLVLPVNKIKTKSGDQQGGNKYLFTNAFDGNNATSWESPWKGNLTPSAKFEFTEAQAITGLRYRSANNNNINGVISAYSISTSANGTDFTHIEDLQNVKFPYKHGVHNMEFNKAVYTKHIKVTFAVKMCVNVAEFNFNYIPTTEADLTRVETEIETSMGAMVTAETAEEGKYTTAQKTAMQTSFTAAKAMAQATDEEKIAKGMALFNVASDIVRGINIATTRLNDNIGTAKALLGASTAGTLPMQWLKADYDAFYGIITTAEELLKTAFAPQGEVNYSVDAINSGMANFKINYIKPTITPERELTGSSIDTATLMDGTSENRFQLSSVDCVGTGGIALEIDFNQQATLISADVTSWYANEQGSPSIKLEYWDGTQYAPITSSIGANKSDANGKIALSWTANVDKPSEIRHIEFDNDITSTKIKLTLFKSTKHQVTGLDEISFGYDLLATDMSLKVTPNIATMAEGETLTLDALVLPMQAPNRAVTWSSSDESIATVDTSGVVTAKTISTATAAVTITGTTVFGGATSECVITVTRGKPSLMAKYDSAKKLNQASYTAESWAKLTESLTAAKTVIDNAGATSAEILAQFTALETAIAALVVDVGDKTALQAKYDEAVLLVQNKYTTNSWAILSGEMDLIALILEDDTATQADVNAAIADLDGAMSQLVMLGDKTALQAKYDEVKNTLKGNYTDSSWDSFTAALNAAKAVLDKAEALQTEIDPKLTALTAAFSGLSEKPVVINKAGLQTKYDELKNTVKGNYTVATWDAFTAALNAAKVVIDNAAATQTEVDSSLASLIQKFGDLTENAPATDDKKGCGAIAVGGNNGGAIGGIMLLVLGMAGLSLAICRKAKQSRSKI